ncbi:MAG: decarboxylase [Oscillatoria sp. SIO1A7]|nr:decarboxylase [Oscillatoria sp. SIO1A7]
MQPRDCQSQGFQKAQRGIGKFLSSASKDIPNLEGSGTNATEAWFLGTKGENADELERLIAEAIRDQAFWRKNYHPGDPSAITEQVKAGEEYVRTMADLKENYRLLLAFLKKSVPFFSMRYQGHMNWDVTLPSILGYFAGMLYNPNNVAFEGSTATTYLEMLVGDDLCRMLGYEMPDEAAIAQGAIRPWGHITSGGTVANIEALWSARNLKFYPIALKAALEKEESLAAAKDIAIPDLSGKTEQSIIGLSLWELLNLRGDDILALPSRIANYGIDNDTLTEAVSKYSLQNIGIWDFARKFLDIVDDPKDLSPNKIGGLPAFLVPGTKHYSWPKAGALLGIGAANQINVPVDEDARLSVAEMERILEECLQKQQPILTVVAVIGSTEESAIDPIAEVLAMREKFRQRGLEFTIHADAAWGGYHAAVIRDDFGLPDARDARDAIAKPTNTTSELMATMLNEYAVQQFQELGKADSITVDPHKSGYIPYPAGALCYRNSAMRDLVTFKAPYIFQGEAEPTVGVYGVEGSKPGAAPAAVYLSHRVIRPSKSGYGKIINRALYGCKKLYARLLCMAEAEDRFVVVPVPRLPAEIAGGSASEVELQMQLIREAIDGKTYEEIAGNKKAIALLPEIGPDQNILIYAFNFKNPDGTLNTDLDAANRLNKQIYERLSINPGDDIYSYDLIVSTTDISAEEYGDEFMKNYCARLLGDAKAIAQKGSIITVLRSVIMDPWVTETTKGSFIDVLEEEFRKAVETVLFQNLIGQILFDKLDTDKSNSIERNEIEDTLQNMGYGEEFIDNFWQMTDINNDEHISLDEFIAKWQKLSPQS